MDRKQVEDMIGCAANQSQIPSIFNCNMKRSAYEFDLDEFLRPAIVSKIGDNDNLRPKDERIREIRVQKARICGETEGFFGVQGEEKCFDDVYAGDLSSFSFEDRETISSFASCRGGVTESLLWTQNFTPEHPSISATIDSQSSICGPVSSSLTFGCTATGSAGSPTSAHKPKSGDNQARRAVSGSSGEQLDDDDREMEAGPCEQSTEPIDLKYIRRKVSNMESARRSRRRKQAHVADLEFQVDQLNGEHVSLCKQLTNANQQFSEANRDNRVLKSDVEALRMQVKLAEEMIAQGSLTCSLNHLLQSCSISPQPFNTHNLCRVSEVSPTLGVHGDEASYACMSISGQISALGLGNGNLQNGGIKNRLHRNTPPSQRIASLEHLQSSIVSEAVSCVSETW